MQALAEEFSGRARLVKVHVDREGGVQEQFEASGLPVYLLFRDSVEIDRLSRFPWFFESRLRRMLTAAVD